MNFKEKINTWIFDLDNTLYSADSGIFQQVHKLMGDFISKNLNLLEYLRKDRLLNDIIR